MTVTHKDGFVVGLWCDDRTAVLRFTTFDWNKGEGISHLAHTLFASSQCSMKNSRFDPNVYHAENDGALDVINSDDTPLPANMRMRKF